MWSRDTGTGVNTHSNKEALWRHCKFRIRPSILYNGFELQNVDCWCFSSDVL